MDRKYRMTFTNAHAMGESHVTRLYDCPFDAMWAMARKHHDGEKRRALAVMRFALATGDLTVWNGVYKLEELKG